MFKIEDTDIHITRGDTGVISVFAEDTDGHDYMYQPGDVVRFKVTNKKDTSTVVLLKEVVVKEVTTCVDIVLESKETKIGELINKPVDYWYEIELNPDNNGQTILGYDEDGPKILTLYPEGGDSDV